MVGHLTICPPCNSVCVCEHVCVYVCACVCMYVACAFVCGESSKCEHRSSKILTPGLRLVEQGTLLTESNSPAPKLYKMDRAHVEEAEWGLWPAPHCYPLCSLGFPTCFVGVEAGQNCQIPGKVVTEPCGPLEFPKGIHYSKQLTSVKTVFGPSFQGRKINP